MQRIRQLFITPVLSLSRLAALLLIFCLILGGCDNNDEDDDSISSTFGEPAHPILEAEGSLHVFSLINFIDLTDVDDDIMTLQIENFTPATDTTEPDEDADDQTTNDLGFSVYNWDESNLVNWVTDSAPLVNDSIYQLNRPYRLFTNGDTLSAPINTLNQPIYEAIDDEVYERQLGVSFLWSMSDTEGEDIEGDDLDQYLTISINGRAWPVLEQADVWASDSDDVFSEGSRLYSGVRIVTSDVYQIESVSQVDGSFSLDSVGFDFGVSSLTAMTANYQTTSLEYQYTLDYSTHRTIYIRFNPTTNEATVSSTDGSSDSTANYTVHSHYLEIDTSSLDQTDLDTLGLPRYFNPIIVGPFTVSGSTSSDSADNGYFYGKRYITSTTELAAQLEPIIFFNSTAINDIQQDFSDWRTEEHTDD